jgi:sugar-specific transcriptional regulator TrmB
VYIGFTSPIQKYKILSGLKLVFVPIQTQMCLFMETFTEHPQIELETVDSWKFSGKDKKNLKPTEIIENMLQALGLSKNETQVYLYLALSKERKASEISEALHLHRTNTYRILGDLEKRGLVSSVFEKPLKFIATPFEQAIETLIETKKLRIQLLEKKKKNLIDVWLSIPKPNIEEKRKEVFQILEGEEQINLKAVEVIQNAQREINVFASEEDLPRFYNSGLTETLEKLSKKNVDINLLTTNSPKSRFFIEKIKLQNKKYAATDNDEVPTFILADQKQLIFIIRKSNEKNHRKIARQKISALWTNYEAFIKALRALFSGLWSNGTQHA